jgi:dTDP-4-dehydrorhamnose 3,5-epimerase
MKTERIKSHKGNFISDLFLISPKIFQDSRGYFYESWNKNLFNKAIGKKIDFVQDNQSSSSRGVLRGLHYQINPYPQGKLVRCLKGEIYDVAIDLRESSKTFGEWAGVYLNEKNKKQIWIPEGFAHGFLTMSRIAEVAYKTTNFWKKNLEKCIKWNDKILGIKWPINDINLKYPQISIKDENGSNFEEAIINF